MPTFPQLFGMSFMIIQIITNWVRRLLRFGPCCDGVSTVGGRVRKAGFKGGGEVRLSLPGFWETCVNSGVTLKGLRVVENAVVAVEESCVLDVKSGIVPIISSGRVFVFNCSLKARYLFCIWKYRLAFSSCRRSFRESIWTTLKKFGQNELIIWKTDSRSVFLRLTCPTYSGR